MYGLMFLVEEYQLNGNWLATAIFLEFLGPHLKELYHDTPVWRMFREHQARWLRHTGAPQQAAQSFMDLSTEWKKDPRGHQADIPTYRLLLQGALSYVHARDYETAQEELTKLDSMIKSMLSQPRAPGDRTKMAAHYAQYAQSEVCFWLALVAYHTKKLGPALMHARRAVTSQTSICSSASPAPGSDNRLAGFLHFEAQVYCAAQPQDLDGLKKKIDEVEKLAMAAAEPRRVDTTLLRARLLHGRGDIVGAIELARKCILNSTAEQEGSGEDDHAWINHTTHDLVHLVYIMERMCMDLKPPQTQRAFLWAERGKMRLFMHRVQERGPSPSASTATRDFDRCDRRAMDMLLKVLLACGPNVALVEYSFQQDLGDPDGHVCMYLLNLLRGSLEVTVCIKDCPGIEEQVTNARNAITSNKKQARIRNLLGKLHSLLVEPLQEHLRPDCDTLIFVPHGCLSLVPFAALYDHSASQYLIQQKQVVVVPCVRALYRCLDLQDEFLNNQDLDQLQQAFVAGNPCPMGMRQPQLEHAEAEAKAVADILNTRPCLGTAMTKKAVIEGLCKSKVVLLATHAVVTPPFTAGALVLQDSKSDMAASPLSQAITKQMMAGILGPAVTAKATLPQVLTAAEISDLKIRAGLVVLSACETGRGIVTPDGLLGLGSALLQAGAASTVLSLWKVDDQHTKKLITGNTLTNLVQKLPRWEGFVFQNICEFLACVHECGAFMCKLTSARWCMHGSMNRDVPGAAKRRDGCHSFAEGNVEYDRQEKLQHQELGAVFRVWVSHLEIEESDQ